MKMASCLLLHAAWSLGDLAVAGEEPLFPCYLTLRARLRLPSPAATGESPGPQAVPRPHLQNSFLL